MQSRKYLSPSEKSRVIDRQRGKCACGCRGELIVGQIQFDHAVALQFGGTNDLSNFVALITKHHQKKSNGENTIRAKCERLKLKHTGQWLNAKDRELASLRSRIKQIRT